MKGRSHRLPTSEPPDDWGDGSWTVDCVCGVNFDDGEEMVNCDECGVWVHTKCSRFVKGETSFACDKCKNKRNRNDSEETEVAQLLVELPTKTMKMENPYPSSAPPRPPFRLWTDIPIEERVHIQGIPGGDPALFQGLSSVFTPELWKCKGYVPKKFNFQYKEFPCWDDKREADARAGEENENLADRGAGVLFSLSKEIASAAPTETFIGFRGSFEGVGCERKRSSKVMKKREGKDSSSGRVQSGTRKERNQLKPLGVHFSKRKKEDSGAPKDRSGKKKVRSADKEADTKKRASIPAIDARKLEFHEDGDFKVVKIDSLDTKNEDRCKSVLPVPDSDGCLEATNNVNKTLNILAVKIDPTEGLSNSISRDLSPTETAVNAEKLDHQASTRNESSPKTGAVALSILKSNDAGSIPTKEEDVNLAVNGLEHLNEENHDPRSLNGGFSSVAVDSQKSKPPVGDLLSAASAVEDSQILQNLNGHSSSISVHPNIKLTMEVDEEHPRRNLDLVPAFSDVKNDATNFVAPHLGKSDSAHVSEHFAVHDTAGSSLPSSDHKARDTKPELEAGSHYDGEKIVDGMISVSGEACQCKQELEGSVEPAIGQEGSSEPKHALKHAEGPSEFVEANPSSHALPSQRKVVVGVAKSSNSSTIVISKSSVSGGYKPLGPSAPQRPIHSSEQQVKVKSYTVKKDHAVSDISRNESRHEVLRKTTKEHSKNSSNSGLKTSQTSRISHASLSKRTPSDSKEQVLRPSSKASLTKNVAVSSSSVDSASSLQTQGPSHLQSKSTASVFSPKGEKANQSSSQPSSKLNHSPSMHPPVPVNSSATLSDEELALLLHQELNSSPRVPRVPRVRHAGSIPPLASPTATSILIKRASSSGGKDQIMASRRTSKEDASKDGSRNSREPGDETKKNRVASSPDHRRQDPDGSTKREASNRSPKVVHSAKKNMPPASTTIANGGPSSSTEANDQNLSSIRNSPRDIADDDTGTISGPAPRTLPGLIDEIMSKGKRMTYEELCNAVLPHWHNLRKHNGERYAYSSHSQAVLDCLRNRNEWSQLVDRGPKTNASRKRRKLDAEPSVAELEENEYDKDRTLKEVEGKSVESHQEDFPKGKRKARKRRRLALQGRGIKDVRKRQKVDAILDDDPGTFSHSSDGSEGIFSEDESQGARTRLIGSEVSTSADEMGPL